MSKDGTVCSADLFVLVGRLSVLTGVLSVPAEFPELYTRDQIADVVRTQHQELRDVRSGLQDLCQALLMKGG